MNINNKSTLILGWHGGWGKFKAADPRYFGKGEGDALGWGFYMAENRKGEEYYGEYFWKRNREGFLHKIVVTTSDHAI